MKNLFLFLFAMIIHIIMPAQIFHSIQFPSGGLAISTLQAEDNNYYSKVELQNLPYNRDEGKPNLPVKYVNLIIPYGQTISNITLSNYSVEQFSLSYPIIPTQSPEFACIDCDDPVFVNPDPMIYNSSTNWPSQQIIKIQQGYFDGANNIVSLQVCPFQYNPVTGNLEYYTSIDFTVNLQTGYKAGILNQKRLAGNQEVYDEALLSLVDNPQDISSYGNTPTSISDISGNGPLPFYEYIIITSNSLAPAFDGLVQWKRKKGIYAGVITIEDIMNNYTGDLIFQSLGHQIIDASELYQQQFGAGGLRQYLYEAYLEGTSWVLLGGDEGVLPIRWGLSDDDTQLWINNEVTWYDEIEADIYFSDFNGDWNVDTDVAPPGFQGPLPPYYGEPTEDDPDYYPEIFVGRLLCGTQQDVLNWIEKVMIYECNPGNGDFSYLTQSLMIQADEFQCQTQAQIVSPHLSSFSHTIIEEIPSCDDLNPTFPKGADITSVLNSDNFGLMSCFTHGGTGIQNISGVPYPNSGILTMSPGQHNGDPGYKYDAEDAYDYIGPNVENNNALDNLVNYNYPFVMYSLACDVIPYHMTKNTNLGARNYGESFTVNNSAGGVAFLGCTRHSYITETYHLYMKFADLVNNANNGGNAHIGVAEGVSKGAFSNHYASYSHNLVGCPETQLWNSTPNILTVNVSPEKINIGDATDFVVTIDNLPTGDKARVCLYKDGEIFETQVVGNNQNNQAIANFYGISVSDCGVLYATVSSYYDIPVTIEIPSNYYIETDVLWDTYKDIQCDVYVKSGGKLTISSQINAGCNVKFIVECYGQLIIDGGKIENQENCLWKGIEVWGNSNAHQFPDASGDYQQGYLEIKNGASIENAYNAVTLWKPDDWNSMGGIIKAYNSVFKNNRRSVEFMSYQNFDPNTGNPRKNEGYFFECDFIVDDDYLATSDFAYHVSMWEVDGVKFKGCDFINSQSLNPNYGYGIFTMDAGYQVTNSCLVATKPCPDTEIIPSTFTGFYAGIKSMGSNSIRPVYVNEGLFNENGYGIKLDASEFATIINNEIYVDDNLTDAIDCGFPFGVGVDLFNSNYYAVEDNEFFESSTISGNSVGTLVNYEEDLWLYPGTFLNEIYNNDYDGLYIGNEALGYNRSRFEFDVGLEYLCNENQNNTYDFYIKDHGIKLLQGKLSEAAGNTFSQNGNNEFSDFNNQAEWPIYYFFDANEPGEIPIYYSEKVNPNAAQGSNDCSSNYGGGNNTQTNGLGLTNVEKDTYEQQYSTNLTDYNGTYALYESLIDGGDTEGVVIDVETSWPDEMLELRDDLLERSPHLSKEVLYAVADNTDVFPDAVIFEILAANPDEMGDEEFLSYLAEKQNPLPDYYIDILRGLAGDISYKTILKSQLSTYKRNMAQAVNIIIRNELNDSICNIDTVRNWLGAMASPSSICQIIDSYLQEGNATDAQSLLNSIPTTYDIAPEDTVEFNRYKNLKQLQINLINQGRNVFMLDSTEKLLLVSISDSSNGIAGTQARNILEFVYGDHFCNCPEIPDSVTHKAYESPSIRLPASAEIELKVFPNPAKSWTAFEYKLPYNDGDVSIIIYNSSGQIEKTLPINDSQGQVIWDVRDTNPGIYFYILKSNNEQKSGNLIIVK